MFRPWKYGYSLNSETLDPRFDHSGTTEGDQGQNQNQDPARSMNRKDIILQHLLMSHDTGALTDSSKE